MSKGPVEQEKNQHIMLIHLHNLQEEMQNASSNINYLIPGFTKSPLSVQDSPDH